MATNTAAAHHDDAKMTKLDMAHAEFDAFYTSIPTRKTSELLALYNNDAEIKKMFPKSADTPTLVAAAAKGIVDEIDRRFPIPPVAEPETPVLAAVVD